MTTEFNINRRFDFTEKLTRMVVTGVTPSLIITGEGGLGKTHTVKQTLKELGLDETEYEFVKGYSTPRGLYNLLFDNNGKTIIFDDCDSVLENKVAINILKGALDSYDERIITWSAKMTKGDTYPGQFEFTGKIIFISNKSKDSIDQAILTRSLTVDLGMTPTEKIERMTYITPNILPDHDINSKYEALSFLDHVKDSCDISIRSLIMVTKMIKEYPSDWRDMATYMLIGQ